MLLIDLEKQGSWILSGWNLTYPTGWERICSAVSEVYPTFRAPEVLCNDRPCAVQSTEDIKAIPEDANLTIRGQSEILKVPVSITFYNQLRNVSVTVAGLTDEFENPDYKSFNLSLGQFLDSVELAMYR